MINIQDHPSLQFFCKKVIDPIYLLFRKFYIEQKNKFFTFAVKIINKIVYGYLYEYFINLTFDGIVFIFNSSIVNFF
jgi:hypothetical protein